MLTMTQPTIAFDEETPERPTTERTVRLTAAEEAALARAWRDHRDEAARERLVKANLGLVVCIAQRYRNAGVPLEELIAEGNLGLICAVDGFDPECGSRLSTYAAYWIRQGISRAFAASTPRGRLNGRDRRDLAVLERASRALYARTGAMPTDAELAVELGWSTERVGVCKSMNLSHARPSSLDQPRGDGLDRPMNPAAPGVPTRDDPADVAAQLDALLIQLPPFQRAAVELRFGLHGAEPQNVDAVATALGSTRRETRKALRMAIATLSRSGRSRPGVERGLLPALGEDGLLEHSQE